MASTNFNLILAQNFYSRGVKCHEGGDSSMSKPHQSTGLPLLYIYIFSWYIDPQWNYISKAAQLYLEGRCPGVEYDMSFSFERRPPTGYQSMKP